jgi:hypothetical protein
LFSLYLANNIDMALKACSPERSDLLRNRDEMQYVLESLDEGFCHVTRKTRDLELVGMYSLASDFRYLLQRQFTGSMGDIKVFAAPGEIVVPNLNIETQHYILFM